MDDRHIYAAAHDKHAEHMTTTIGKEAVKRVIDMVGAVVVPTRDVVAAPLLLGTAATSPPCTLFVVWEAPPDPCDEGGAVDRHGTKMTAVKPSLVIYREVWVALQQRSFLEEAVPPMVVILEDY
jgi:hypothetical protein